MPTTTAPKHSFHAFRDGLQTSLLARFPDHVERLGWSRAQIAARSSGVQVSLVLVTIIGEIRRRPASRSRASRASTEG